MSKEKGAVVGEDRERNLESFLFGVTATDPQTIGLAGIALAAVALAAAALPAWRAARLDPVTALRTE